MLLPHVFDTVILVVGLEIMNICSISLSDHYWLIRLFLVKVLGYN